MKKNDVNLALGIFSAAAILAGPLAAALAAAAFVAGRLIV